MDKKIVILLAAVLSAALPMAVSAIILPNTAPGGNQGLRVEQIINAILNFVWPIFLGFAVIMFVVAAFYFIIAQGDADKVASARQFVIYGIVGVAVGVLAFSLPFVVQNTLCGGGVC